jgi:hypothetical protein
VQKSERQSRAKHDIIVEFTHISTAIANDDAFILFLSSKCYGSDGSQRFVARSDKDAFMHRNFVNINRSVGMRSIHDVNISIRVAKAEIQTRR